MDDRAVSRMTAASGFASVVVILMAFAIFGALSPPTQSDSPQAIAQFFADNRTPLAVLIYLVAMSFGFNLIFFVGLRDVLKRRAPRFELVATIGLSGAVVFIAIAYVGFGVLLQLVYREGAGSADTQKTLFDIYNLNITIASIPSAVAVGAISLLALRTTVLPNWLGWYGMAVAAVHLVVMGALARDGFFSPSVLGGYVAPLMFYAWVLGMSVLMWREGPSAT